MIPHFFPPLLGLKGHVRYSAKGLHSRASILFLIVLGQGLDQLTSTFSFVVGPAGFGKFSIGMLISTAMILVGQFSLFFGSPRLRKRCVRGLIWFFGQFIYTSALIVLISATANELIVFNFTLVANGVLGAVDDIDARQVHYFPDKLNISSIPHDDILILKKTGIAASDILNETYQALVSNDSDAATLVFVRQYLSTLFTVAEEFELQPKPTDPLYWHLQEALSSNDTATVDLSVGGILNDFLREHADSVTWFPASGGATLIATAILRYVRQTPRDKWEWANILTIGGAGVAYALLSILDVGSRKPVFDPTSPDAKFNSPIFKFEDSGWVLPSLAILSLVVLVSLGVQNHFARRSIRRKIQFRPLNIYAPVGMHMRMDSTGPWTDPFVTTR